MKLHHALRRTAALLGTAAAMLCGGISAQGARIYEECIPNCKVYDVQNVLTEAEEEALNTQIRTLSAETELYIAVVIYGPETAFSSDSAVERTADDNYDRLFNPQTGVDTDGVLLLINNSTQYDYLSTSGLGQLYYYNGAEDNRTRHMLENITPCLKREDYVGAIEQFCSDVSYYYEVGVPKNAYTFDASIGEYYYEKDGVLVHSKKLPFAFGVNFGLCAFLALLFGGITFAIAFAAITISYNGKKALSPTNYICKDETRFTVREDHFLRKHTARHHIDSGGGGGGGGGGHSHHSSGGHSHGGGGHHR